MTFPIKRLGERTVIPLVRPIGRLLGELFSVNARPDKRRRLAVILSLTLFIILISVYVGLSIKNADTDQQKITPTVGKMMKGFYRVAFVKDIATGKLRLFFDLWASAKRFLTALFFLFFAIPLGVIMGRFPWVEVIFLRFFQVFDKIPALVIFPVLGCVMGMGETTKITIILASVFPTITLDTYLRSKAFQQELVIKAQTLGASDFEIAIRIVLTRIFPDVLQTIRLNFKSMVQTLIGVESYAAAAGVGFRIYLVQRMLAMDIILPYVIVIVLLMFALDIFVLTMIRKYFPWRQER